MSIFDQKLIGKDNLGLLMKRLGKSQLTPDEMSAFSAIGDEGQIPSDKTANRFSFITGKTRGFVPKGDEFQSIFEPKGKGFELTDDFKNAPANREDFGVLDTFKKSQQDYLQDFMESDDYQKLNDVQKLFIENKIKQTKQDQQLSFLNQMGLQMGLVNPELQMGPELAFLGFGGYNPFGTPFMTSDVQPAQSGILLGLKQMGKDMAGQYPIQTAEQAAGQTPTQQAIRQQQEETQQKIIDEVKQSGGGGGPAGMVGTPSGPGQTGGPAGMGFAPSNNPTGFGSNIRIGKATGGLVELEGDTTQNNPNMLPPLAGRRGPFPVGGGGGLASIEGGFNNRLPLPDLRQPGPGFGNFIGIRPLPPLLGVQPSMPDYSSQFEQIGEQLGGFGKQLDALGSFNEQVGGLGKQFEAVNNKLDSLEKGLGSLGNQIASFENTQKAEPQEVMQPQRPSYSPFGLANLFMNMRRF